MALAQSSLADYKHHEGQRQRDEAIRRVGLAASDTWKAVALDALNTVAGHGRDFTSDDVWEVLDKWNVSPPQEKRAMGAIFQRARSLGIATPTEQFIPTARPQAHCAPIRVWRGGEHGY